MLTMLMKLKLTKWESINSPTGLKKNSKQFYLDQELNSQKLLKKKLTINQWLDLLIGSQEEPLQESKTKQVVVHAGLSPLLELLNLLNGTKQEVEDLSPNNKPFLVILPTVDALEVSTGKPLPIMPIMEFVPQVLTHILLIMLHAESLLAPKILSQPAESKEFQEPLLSKVPSIPELWP